MIIKNLLAELELQLFGVKLADHIPRAAECRFVKHVLH